MLVMMVGYIIGADAQTTKYGYYKGDEAKLVAVAPGNIGTRNVHCATAMKVDANATKGGKLKAIEIPVNPNVTNTSNYYAFVATKLEIDQQTGRAIGDVFVTDFTPAQGKIFNMIELPEPYTIDGGELYVGYGLRASAPRKSAENNVLVGVKDGGHEGGYYLFAPSAITSFTDKSLSFGASSAIVLNIEGLAAENCVIAPAEKLMMASGENKMKVSIVNHGSTTVQDIDYSVTMRDQDGTEIANHNAHVVMDEAIGCEYFGQTSEAILTVPTLPYARLYTMDFSIDKVNGKPNTSASVVTSIEVQGMKLTTKKTPLVEEFTGTWCPNCSRGWAAMKYMAEAHENFVGAAYHNDDPMMVVNSSDFPVRIQGYPEGSIDRKLDIDPLLGSSKNSEIMGIERDWALACNEYAPANVTVSANYNEDKSCIDVTSTVAFAFDIDDANYGISYILTADGMTGTTDSWYQRNAYPGADFGTEPGAYGGYLDQISASGSKMKNIEYDDVVIATTNLKGGSIEGSVPSTINAGEELTWQHEWVVADLRSIYSSYSKVNLAKIAKKLNVIAVLINNKTKHVENCAKCEVMDFNINGVEGIETISQHRDSRIYDLQGRRVNTSHTLTPTLSLIGRGRKVIVR